MSVHDDADIYEETEVYAPIEGAFNEPTDRQYNADSSHPRYDSNIDDQELYDAGMAAASGIGDFANPEANDRFGHHSARYFADNQ